MNDLKAMIMKLLSEKRLELLVETGWHPSEPGTHAWLSFDSELLTSVLVDDHESD